MHAQIRNESLTIDSSRMEELLAEVEQRINRSADIVHSMDLSNCSQQVENLRDNALNGWQAILTTIKLVRIGVVEGREDIPPSYLSELQRTVSVQLNYIDEIADVGRKISVGYSYDETYSRPQPEPDVVCDESIVESQRPQSAIPIPTSEANSTVIDEAPRPEPLASRIPVSNATLNSKPSQHHHALHTTLIDKITGSSNSTNCSSTVSYNNRTNSEPGTFPGGIDTSRVGSSRGSASYTHESGSTSLPSTIHQDEHWKSAYPNTDLPEGTMIDEVLRPEPLTPRIPVTDATPNIKPIQHHHAVYITVTNTITKSGNRITHNNNDSYNTQTTFSAPGTPPDGIDRSPAESNRSSASSTREPSSTSLPSTIRQDDRSRGETGNNDGIDRLLDGLPAVADILRQFSPGNLGDRSNAKAIQTIAANVGSINTTLKSIDESLKMFVQLYTLKTAAALATAGLDHEQVPSFAQRASGSDSQRRVNPESEGVHVATPTNVNPETQNRHSVVIIRQISTEYVDIPPSYRSNSGNNDARRELPPPRTHVDQEGQSTSSEKVIGTYNCFGLKFSWSGCCIHF